MIGCTHLQKKTLLQFFTKSLGWSYSHCLCTTTDLLSRLDSYQSPKIHFLSATNFIAVLRPIQKHFLNRQEPSVSPITFSLCSTRQKCAHEKPNIRVSQQFGGERAKRCWKKRQAQPPFLCAPAKNSSQWITMGSRKRNEGNGRGSQEYKLRFQYIDNEQDEKLEITYDAHSYQHSWISFSCDGSFSANEIAVADGTETDQTVRVCDCKSKVLVVWWICAGKSETNTKIGWEMGIS